MADFLKGALSQATDGLKAQSNNVASNIRSDLQGNATEGLTNLTNSLQAQENKGLINALSQGTNDLSSQIPGLGKGLAAVNTAKAISAALTPVTTKEDIIKGVSLILEDKITNIIEDKITKSLEEKITEKVEVKVIQKLEEITKTVNDAIKTGIVKSEESKINITPEVDIKKEETDIAEPPEAENIPNNISVGGRKSRKQKKNRITRKRRTNQKSFSRAFRRTQGRKRNSR